MLQRKSLLGLLLAGVLLAVGGASGVTICLNPTDDVSIWSAYPDRNLNQVPDYTNQTLMAGYSYIGPHYENALLKFDMSALPGDAVISSARLFLYCIPTSDEHTFLYSTSQDNWDEDTVTWNSYAPYVFSGTMIADTDIDQIYPGNAQWFEWVIDTANWNWSVDIQDNLTTFLLKGDSSDYNYSISAVLASKEYRDVSSIAYLPRLEITYVPEPATLLLLAFGGGLSWRRRAAKSSRQVL